MIIVKECAHSVILANRFTRYRQCNDLLANGLKGAPEVVDELNLMAWVSIPA